MRHYQLGLFVGLFVLFALFAFLCVGCQSQSRPPPPVHRRMPDASKEYALALQVADAAEKAGNPEAAEAALKKAHEQSPTDSKPVVMLAELYNLIGEYQKAASLIQLNLPQFQRQPAVLSELQRQQALAYWHLNQSNLALASLVSAYAHAAHPDRVLNDMGVLLDQLSEHRLAQSCYRRGLRAAPNSDILMSNYALSLLCTANIGAAKELLNNPALIGSNNPGVLNIRAQATGLLEHNAQSSSTAIAGAVQKQLKLNQTHAPVTSENRENINNICMVGDIVQPFPPLPSP